PAAIGMLPRTGRQKSAAPMICTPGIRKKTPTNSPMATPRGTERRVKRQYSLCRTRGPSRPNTRIQRLSAICSRLGMLVFTQRSSQLPFGAGGAEGDDVEGGRDSAMLSHEPALLALPVFLFLIIPLVVRLAPARQRNLHLRPALAVEIDAEGHDRHALAGDGAVQLGELAMVQQQFARPLRLVIVTVAVAEFWDVGVDQPGLLVLHLGVALGDRTLAEAKRLHLGSGEHDAGLIFVLDRIV